MTTELDLFKEFAMCSIDEFTDEKNQNGTFCLSEKSIWPGFVSFREESCNCSQFSDRRRQCPVPGIKAGLHDVPPCWCRALPVYASSRAIARSN